MQLLQMALQMQLLQIVTVTDGLVWKEIQRARDESLNANIPGVRKGHTVVAYKRGVFLWGGQPTHNDDVIDSPNHLFRFDTGSVSH